MHVAIAAVFDPSTVPGGYSFRVVRQLIKDRIPLVPVFRRRLVEVPFRLGHPLWVDDPEFEIDNHLRRAALPSPGGMRELAEFSADMRAASCTGTGRCGRCGGRGTRGRQHRPGGEDASQHRRRRDRRRVARACSSTSNPYPPESGPGDVPPLDAADPLGIRTGGRRHGLRSDPRLSRSARHIVRSASVDHRGPSDAQRGEQWQGGLPLTATADLDQCPSMPGAGSPTRPAAWGTSSASRTPWAPR